jgi:hypothetical protein
MHPPLTVTGRLVLEALSNEWQAEPEVVAYVRRHAKPVPPIRAVLTALDVLSALGHAQCQRFPGYKTMHWRATR